MVYSACSGVEGGGGSLRRSHCIERVYQALLVGILWMIKDFWFLYLHFLIFWRKDEF